MLKIAKVLLLLSALSGCSILNPYKGDFSCPIKENGKCVSVTTAHAEAKGTRVIGNAPQVPLDDARYKAAVLNRMSSVIEQPIVPLVSSPKTVRLLVLPYEGENRFYSERYVYLLLGKPSWFLSTGKDKE